MIGDGWGFPRGFATGKAPKWDASDQQKYWTTICMSYIYIYISYLILEFGISVFTGARSPQSTALFRVLHSFSMPTIWFSHGKGMRLALATALLAILSGNSFAKCSDFY